MSLELGPTKFYIVLALILRISTMQPSEVHLTTTSQQSFCASRDSTECDFKAFNRSTNDNAQLDALGLGNGKVEYNSQVVVVLVGGGEILLFIHAV